MTIQKRLEEILKLVIFDGENSYSHEVGYEDVEYITLKMIDSKTTAEVEFSNGRSLTYLERYIVCYEVY